MTTQLLTGDEIFGKLMAHIAPLPCQESYARDLASIFSMHLKRNALMDIGISPESLPNNAAIIVAPSGQGKTFLFQQMAQLVDINTIVVDASALSREGWKGLSLSQQLLAAQKAVGNPDVFSRSILFFDEIDKLVDAHSEAGNPQPNLLQLFNNGTICCDGEKQGVETVDVSRFTVVMAGAFTGLDRIIERRLKPQARIGFGQSAGAPKWSKADLMKQVTSADLARYGLMTELLGRVGTILVIDPM